VMTSCTGKSVNHAVLIVGFGFDPDVRLQYWIVKNSWGSKWGESGYIRLAYGSNQCGLKTVPYAAKVSVTGPPAPFTSVPTAAPAADTCADPKMNSPCPCPEECWRKCEDYYQVPSPGGGQVPGNSGGFGKPGSGGAYYCAKGCAKMAEKTVVDRDFYCTKPDYWFCMTLCQKASHSPFYQQACRVGCRHWPQASYPQCIHDGWSNEQTDNMDNVLFVNLTRYSTYVRNPLGCAGLYGMGCDHTDTFYCDDPGLCSFLCSQIEGCTSWQMGELVKGDRSKCWFRKNERNLKEGGPQGGTSMVGLKNCHGGSPLEAPLLPPMLMLLVQCQH